MSLKLPLAKTLKDTVSKSPALKKYKKLNTPKKPNKDLDLEGVFKNLKGNNNG